MLMNLNTLDWDIYICEKFGINVKTLPKIGYESLKILNGSFNGCEITSSMGDQHAALLGSNCLSKGDINCVLGTGGFIMVNSESLLIDKSLISTVGFQLKKDIFYALESPIACFGNVFKWIENIGFNNCDDLTDLAKDCISTEILFFPYFSGIFAPFWRSDIKGQILNISLSTTKPQIALGIMQGLCFQLKFAIDQIPISTKGKAMKISGGVTSNTFFMQMIANVVQKRIQVSENPELTAFGVAVCAGINCGFWESVNDIPKRKFIEFIPEKDFETEYRIWISKLENYVTK